tara:strand:+ start:12750 stop:14396 length:1647 start_codon:yes stop_codon:yes gene_type:complete
MRKKKVLFVTEASWKSTGYSVYTKEVLSRLNQIEALEVAELACYAPPEAPEINTTPWTVFPNRPASDSPEFQQYKSRPSSIFGEWSFNRVCLEFNPDVVMDIRDWWMLEFQQRSPFRDLFHWAIMPTVDATPQNPQWMNTFQSADSVFAYSEFGRDVMLGQCDNLNFVDIASPAASKSFFPVPDKDKHRDAMGMDSDAIIIGTVMRNQRRKLYPDLFKSFRTLLDETQDKNLFLLCHTYYPDIGWEIPNLINKFGLNNRVLFSYRCKKCGHVSVDFFRDAISFCDKCDQFSKQLVGIDNSINEQELNNIYNLCDIYVQYANSEGFGMPQLEAVSAGLPLVATDYSAMQSVVKNVSGYGIPPAEYSLEAETGCYRAVPNNRYFVDLMKDLLSQGRDFWRSQGELNRKLANQRYSWDQTANVWAERILSIPMKSLEQTWLSPVDIFQPAQGVPENLSSIDKVNFIFTNILNKPEWIGGYLWSKILKDCTYNYRLHNSNEDFYFNESHIQDMDRYEPFNINKAVEEMIKFRGQMNDWENLRLQMIQSGDIR